MLPKKDIENISKNFDAKKKEINRYDLKHRETFREIIRSNIWKYRKEKDFLSETKNLKDKNNIEFSEKFLKKIFKEIDEHSKKLEFEMHQYNKMLANTQSIRLTQYASEIFWSDWKKYIK